MFKKLRNHFILINLTTTTAILIAAFASVYLIAKNSSDARRPLPLETTIEFSENGANIRQFMEERILADRKDSLASLLLTLIITGLSVEIVVTIFSYLLAEQEIGRAHV